MLGSPRSGGGGCVVGGGGASQPRRGVVGVLAYAAWKLQLKHAATVGLWQRKRDGAR